jgi:hypothetical protein
MKEASCTFICFEEKITPRFKAAKHCCMLVLGRKCFQGLQIDDSHGVSLTDSMDTEETFKNRITCCLKGK